MKKISTKIIILSLINSIIVAAINVGSSLFMTSTNDATTEATGDMAATPGFMIPNTIIIGLAVSLIIGVILSYILGRIISKPILQMTEVAEKTASLDLQDDEAFLEAIQKKEGEIGKMAAALGQTRKVLREMAIRLQDFSSTVSSHSSSLSKNTEENVQSITQVVTTINGIAVENTVHAQTINDSNATLLEVVNLIEEMTNEASRGSDYAVSSIDAVSEGQKSIDLQTAKMDENIEVSMLANNSINELSEMIKQVGGIVTVIDSIAEQTKLLALNASIEASRAGDAGRGFNVVAGEVRDLADKSATAAKEIASLITKTTEKSAASVTNISKSTALIQEQKDDLKITTSTFEKIKTAYDSIVKSFKHTATSAETVNQKSKQISIQMQDMTKTAEEFAASTEEISASGQEQLNATEIISQATNDLHQLAGELNIEINKFKV
ncbi:MULTISPECIES: methyl-accepting chemotaxis protein [Paraliobacillus]|uniref:methyl-accepting chemotaxis protein n=1 Tax=Paraliobacillus TaxID=200903 RepID=UPI000DD39A09|nr:MULTISPECIES: methyl-accepting chemotaxis protein [Paraliobacillus]